MNWFKAFWRKLGKIVLVVLAALGGYIFLIIYYNLIYKPTCPVCGKKIPYLVGACPHCGAGLEWR